MNERASPAESAVAGEVLSGRSAGQHLLNPVSILYAQPRMDQECRYPRSLLLTNRPSWWRAGTLHPFLDFTMVNRPLKQPNGRPAAVSMIPILTIGRNW
ncbi:MAG: hypothetical protein WD032_03500 [Nitrospirales bacterium]